VKNNWSVCITALTLLAAGTIPLQLPAQQPRYKLIDVAVGLSDAAAAWFSCSYSQ